MRVNAGPADKTSRKDVCSWGGSRRQTLSARHGRAPLQEVLHAAPRQNRRVGRPRGGWVPTAALGVR
eukprot:11172284-Lingulodinium_polyedra.AAC.1